MRFVRLSNSTSLTWSGYAAFNSTFTDVKGSWTQPAATCNGKSTHSSFWLGLDGYDSSTVEQIGTEADCSKGKPVYYAWWELFPGASRPINFFTVTPGVTYTAEVQTDGNDVTLTLAGGGTDPNRSPSDWVARRSAPPSGSPKHRPCARRPVASSRSPTSAR